MPTVKNLVLPSGCIIEECEDNRVSFTKYFLNNKVIFFLKSLQKVSNIFKDLQSLKKFFLL